MRSRFLLLALVTLFTSCSIPDLPDTNSSTYQEVITAFYSSVASIQSGEDAGAQDNLLKVVNQAPGEPAAWYNLGLIALRQNDFEQGEERLTQAALLAPENGEIQRLIGAMELAKGNMDQGIAALRKAVELDATDIKASFALAQELGRTGEPADIQEALGIYNQLQDVLPENLVVLVELSRLSAQQGDFAALAPAVEAIEPLSDEWEEAVAAPFTALQEAVSNQDGGQALVQAGFLRNMLLSTYAYRQDLVEVQTPTEEVGDLMVEFLRLPSPSAKPSPPDEGLSYSGMELAAQRTNSSLPGPISWASRALLDGEEPSTLLTAGSQFVSVSEDDLFTREDAGNGSFDVALLDYNYDFRVDIVHANADGLMIIEQDTNGVFFEKVASSMMDAQWANAPYTHVWTADLDSEGDLDLLLSSPELGTVALRNTGDSRFEQMDVFSEVPDVVDFAWADFDGDGDPDPSLLSASGELYQYANERLGQFTRRVVPPVFGGVTALAVGDINSDGRMDLVCLSMTGGVYRISDDPEGGWIVNELFNWEGIESLNSADNQVFTGDFDINGSIDILVSTEQESRVWLSDENGAYQPLSTGIDGQVLSVARKSTEDGGDGLLDLIGLTADGGLMEWEGAGTKPYHWQVLRPRAGQALGDQRINSFTIGGEVEIRSGLLYQKQPILSPVVHLGLGEREKTDVARLIWPNGDIQSEFDLEADQSIFTPQRLKGSCPWLFTFDGEKMQFVTDFIWRSPLGLRINAQETAGIMTTEDWVKIPGEALVPKDGYYDVRITAELWETHFFDHVSLMAVDHPEETEIFVDERFAFPPPELKVHHVSGLLPVPRVLTDQGVDVTETVRLKDEAYLDFFGRGGYQGITRDHYIEVELDERMIETKEGTLVGAGWVRPTDSSINVAISQGAHAPPQALVVEVPDGQGGWEVALPNVGFPAGKTKTILIDLTPVLQERTVDRVRLRTNLEIYWDQIGWVAPQPEDDFLIQPVPLASVDLQYRGFSRVTAANASSPELPDYQELAGTMPRWRDLVGYYTRFGDVSELLETVDDRYVIMNAGDEMRFMFEALPPVKEGFRRDFVLVGDGWVKDGDYNTTFSKTVIPLPSHDQPSYTTPPTTLWNDPVYKKHPDDWTRYHTRYVSTERFATALVTGQ
ncbi:MAG: hypothetical protein KTR29_00320 [Rhodothermaceae bacterium]|nr:hypothetical protein [Rhodothermaceae bacterium]